MIMNYTGRAGVLSMGKKDKKY
ncbi:MAG: hypothetical protein K0S76_2819, partial [Herbinix sp.]|nr:hypothetical protein [Herbinix sp.]